MEINWKVRFKHKPFLVALFSAVLLLAQQVARMFGYDITQDFSDQVTGIFNTVLSILILLGIVSDPTTEGTGDSKQAQAYNKPKEKNEWMG